LIAKTNKIEIAKKRIDGEIRSELFVNPDDFNIVYSDVLINFTVVKIQEKKIIIGIIS
tara:strand:+ start:47 stop:220 length:174 start_codon:yes stop_codon:yes gene_type:complete